MTDREKLIGLLITANDLSTLDREADFLLANGVTVQRWIPVTERLPEAGVKAIAVTKNGSCMVVGYNHRFKRWQCAGNIVFTHWMPLPEPPKEG